MKGRGVLLELIPASGHGSFARVCAAEGIIVGETLVERIVAETRRKTEKVRNGTRAKMYNRRWLVFDDQILMAPCGVLDVSEQARIATMIQKGADLERWSKIVSASRFQAAPAPRKAPQCFWAPWEDARHPKLPAGVM